MTHRQTITPREDATGEADVVDDDEAGHIDVENLTATGTVELPADADADPSAEASRASERRHQPGAFRRTIVWLARRWVPVIVTIGFIASASAAGATYWSIRRSDTQTNAQVNDQVLDAAAHGMTALLTYAPDSFDKDFAAAKARLTGHFLEYYGQFTEKVVAPAVKQREVKTNANVEQAAVSRLAPDNAVVLVFINQVTTSKDRAEPSLATSSVQVTLVRQNNAWLISDVNPV